MNTLKLRLRYGSISAPIAIAIVVSVAVTIAILFALWSAGIMGQAGYGTRPTKLGISDFRVIGPYTMIMVQNLGDETVYVDDVMINKISAKPLTAFEYNTMAPRLTWSGKEWLVKVKPGELVEIWLQTNETVQLKPGIAYQVKVHITKGFWAYKIIKAERWMLVPTTLDIYIRDIDLTYHLDFGKSIFLVKKGRPGTEGTVVYGPKTLPILVTDKVYVSDVLNKYGKPLPAIVVLNPYAGKKDFHLWFDHHKGSITNTSEWGSGYYYLEKISDAVPFLDYMMFFEDAVFTKSLQPNDNCDYDFNELVTRIAWTKQGYALVEEYFSAHGYTFDVYVGGKYVFTEKGTYENICGAYKGDDLRCPISDRIFKVIP